MPAAHYAAHHVLAKGALFLAVGVVASAVGARLWPVLCRRRRAGAGPRRPAADRRRAGEARGEGRSWATASSATLASLSGAGTTLLMLHFLGRLVAARTGRGTVPLAGLVLPWLVTSLAAVAVPWLLYPTAEALMPTALWDSGWPVLLGAGLAVPLHLWGRHLPGIPEGDLVVLYLAATRRLAACGDLLVRLEAGLRRWPVAGVLLLALTLALGAAFLAG